jgi:hypothetical protein
VPWVTERLRTGWYCWVFIVALWLLSKLPGSTSA